MDPTSLNPIWQTPTVVLTFAALAAVGGTVAWLTAAGLAAPLRLAVTALRVLAIALVGLIAMNPGRWLYEDIRHDTEWAVLIDTSESMGVEDMAGDTPQRLARARALAEEIKHLAGEDMPVRFYPFASDLGEQVPAEQLGKLSPGGGGTDIPRAGQTLFARPDGGLAGIVLLSDGRQVGDGKAEALALRARARETPIFALPVSGVQEICDLSLRADRRHYVGFPDQPLRVAAIVEAAGLGRIAPVVELLDDEGKVIEKQEVVLEGDGKARAIFTITPAEGGYRSYRLRTDVLPGEAREDNNEASFGVSTLDEPLQILVAEGTPYWDSKFLVQFLRAQPSIEVVSNYRLSPDRFFQVQTDVATGDQTQRPTFPDTAEELSRFDMVIFGKGAEYFLTDERIALLRDYVREQGGTVLFARGKPYSTPMPALSVLEPGTWGEALDRPFTFAPTPAGQDAGLFDAELLEEDASIWQKLPPLEHAHLLPRLKPFAEVLVNGHYDQGGVERSFPAVLAQRYGQGVIITVNADGLWTWDFSSRDTRGEQLYERFWNQLVQWAVTFAEYLPGQEFSLRLSTNTALPGETVRAKIGRRGSAEDAGQPVVRVLRGGEMVSTLQPAPVAGDATRWELLFSLDEPGDYRLNVAPADAGPDSPGPSEAFEVIAPPTERSNTAGNTPYLRALAEASGGRLITPEDLPEVIDPAKARVTVTQREEAEWQTLWDTPWLLGFLLGCLTLEWVLRRRNGLL